ncbi:general transcription factor IIH subunit 4-like protein [Leptotrombidium deliense]|uniref:General transcription factor IIH subunit 4 n=1 Tax=Leptotrombidium deliense TaxID=299467 RepID=A0A443RZK0_9ACAR|nr:general transcription factor IIH subunit 4-like protein [Leptotrombidium deliense]
MSEALEIFLQTLRELGLKNQRKITENDEVNFDGQRKDGRFYPTRLMINLTKGNKDVIAAGDRKGYIIVETNYRVYAYTDSPLQISLIALFTEMHYRFPKFCLGVLTRESIRQAFRSGITADQIINFLKQHSHPEMNKSQPVLPPTERERDRFLFHEGVLYSQFLSQNDFELLRKYANDAGHLIWDNPAKRVMVVSHSGHDDISKHV